MKKIYFVAALVACTYLQAQPDITFADLRDALGKMIIKQQDLENEQHKLRETIKNLENEVAILRKEKREISSGAIELNMGAKTISCSTNVRVQPIVSSKIIKVLKKDTHLHISGCVTNHD
jgi:hypothetical protein